MSKSESFTELTKGLACKDSAAAAKIWDLFVQDMVDLARQKINPRIRQRLDPDDVVQSAFRSFFQGVSEGKFTIPNSECLKQLLRILVLRKTYNAIARHACKRRDYRREYTEATLGDAFSLDELLAKTPTPLTIVAIHDEFNYLIGKLSKDELRRIVHLKYQGMKNEEIAIALNCCLRNVERKIELIRAEWRSAYYGITP